MNASTVISVNPGKATLGSLHPDVTSRIIRRHMITETRERKNHISFLNLIFGLNGHMPSRISRNTLIFRLVFCLFTLGMLVSGGFGEITPMQTIILYTSVLSLLSGTFQRIIAIISAVTFGIITFGNGLTPEINATTLLSMMISLAFAISGPGKCSMDAWLRNTLHSQFSSYAKERKMQERRLSYKAMHYVAR